MMLVYEASALHASFRLARDLMARGYRVVYETSPNFVRYLAQNGFEYLMLRSRLGEGPPGLRRFARETQVLREAFPDELPALVILDQLLWYWGGPFKNLGVPIIGFNANLGAAINPWLPPVTANLLPRRQTPPFSRWRVRLAWWKLFLLGGPHLKRSFFYRLTRQASWSLPRKLKKTVEALGLEIGLWEYGYRLRLPELVAAPRALEFPGAPEQEDRHYMGACVDPERRNHLVPWSSKTAREDPLDWSSIATDKPVVYCSLSTLYDDFPGRDRFFAAVCDAFRARPHLHLLLQIRDHAGRHSDPPANVTIVPWAPQLEVLARAALFITHGGFASVREGAYHGVPMLVFPCWLDQFGNAARVVHHGLGLRGDLRRESAESLGAKVDSILAEPAFREAARSMQRVIQQEKDSDKALAFIEKVLSSSAASPSIQERQAVTGGQRAGL